MKALCNNWVYFSEMRCAAPTLPRNSRVIGDNFAFGGKLTLLCHPGYELRLVGEMVGRTTFECSKNRLWKPDPALYVCARTFVCKLVVVVVRSVLPNLNFNSIAKKLSEF